MAYIRQSRPGSGLGFHVEVPKTFQVVPPSLGNREKLITCLRLGAGGRGEIGRGEGQGDVQELPQGTYKPVTARFWHISDSHAQIMAQIRQSRPDSGLGFQVKVLETFQDVPSSLGNGERLITCLRLGAGGRGEIGRGEGQGDVQDLPQELSFFSTNYLKAEARIWP